MEKTYYYQPHIRYSEGAVGWFFAVLIAGCFTLPFLLGCRPIVWQCPAVRLSVYLAGTLLCMAILLRMACRQWKYASIVVAEDYVGFYGPFSVRRIMFRDVTDFRYFHFLYWFGVAVVRTENSTVALPFVIQDASGLIRTVAGRLRARGMGYIFDTARFNRFIRAARVNDLINNKIFEDFPLLAAIVMASVAGSAFTAVHIWKVFFIFTLLWTAVGFVVPLAAYLTANMLIAGKVARRMGSGEDNEMEMDTSGIYSRAAFAAGIVYLCLGIVIKWYSMQFH